MKNSEYDSFRLVGVPTRDTALLLQDWFVYLAKGQLEINGSGSSEDTWRLSAPDQDAIKLSWDAKRKELGVEAKKGISSVVQSVLSESKRRVDSQHPLPGSWWTIHFSTNDRNMDQSSMLHMFRHLGAYKRGPEKLRLAGTGLLEVDDQIKEQPALLPKLAIKVTFVSAGAANGPFSKLQADRMVPVLGAVLSSCYGTPLSPSLHFYAAKEDDLDQVITEVNSDETPELGFAGLPIWRILRNSHLNGAGEFADRVIGAMMAYEAGMSQKTDRTTLLFFISAIEALTTPNLKSARTQRINKRFCYFLEEFCGESMDKVMAHGNFRQAFGRISSRKRLATALYNMRSQPVHTGHFGNYSGMMMADDQSLKIGLVNDLVSDAIGTLLRRPVSLLWGHPTLDPAMTIRLDPIEHQELAKKAKNHHRKPEDFVAGLIRKSISS